MPMAPVVPGGLAKGGAGSALYPHAPAWGRRRRVNDIPKMADPVAAVVVDPEPAVDDRATAPPIESIYTSGASRSPRTRLVFRRVDALTAPRATITGAFE